MMLAKCLTAFYTALTEYRQAKHYDGRVEAHKKLDASLRELASVSEQTAADLRYWLYTKVLI